MYGVESLKLNWFSSYLNNRKQLYQVNGVYSKTEDSMFGVPQGSCLRPLLTISFTNSFPLSLKEYRTTMYVDDTSTSYRSGKIANLTEFTESAKFEKNSISDALSMLHTHLLIWLAVSKDACK